MQKYWQNLKPKTRRMVIGSCAATAMTLIVCAAASGSMAGLFDVILEIVK